MFNSNNSIYLYYKLSAYVFNAYPSISKSKSPYGMYLTEQTKKNKSKKTRI